MDDEASRPEVSRTYAVAPRAVMAAVLHVHPRHVKLTSANARTMRFTFDAQADGFHIGEHLTAVLEEVASGTRVTLRGGSATRREASERTMLAFLGAVGDQIARDAREDRSETLRT